MSGSPDYTDNPEVVHEESDVNVSGILRWGAGLAIATFISLAFLWWLVGFYGRQAQQPPQQFPLAAAGDDVRPPTPRLQSTPQQDLRDLVDRQRALLNGYGWVNKEAGTARIPIDDAMRLVVERGLPARAEPPAAASGTATPPAPAAPQGENQK